MIAITTMNIQPQLVNFTPVYQLLDKEMGCSCQVTDLCFFFLQTQPSRTFPGWKRCLSPDIT